MELLLLIFAVPVAIWVLDRVFYRSELTEAVVEAFTAARDAGKKSRKARRASAASGDR